MAEPIEMPTGGLLCMGPRNHVLHEVVIPSQEGRIFGDCPAHWKVQPGSLCCGVRSKSYHSVLNNGMTARLPQLGVALHCHREKSAPAMRPFVKILWKFVFICVEVHLLILKLYSCEFISDYDLYIWPSRSYVDGWWNASSRNLGKSSADCVDMYAARWSKRSTRGSRTAQDGDKFVYLFNAACVRLIWHRLRSDECLKSSLDCLPLQLLLLLLSIV